MPDDLDRATSTRTASNVSAGPARPEISIVLCTHDRAGHLRAAIASLLDQGETRWPWELILVDNCSTDATPVIGAHLAARGFLRYLHEPTLGLCHARNAGWRAARGTYVAYFDDDAIAEPGWIDAIADAFSMTPAPGVVGGKVTPMFEVERPAWLSREIELSLTVLDWSDEPKYIPDVRIEWLVGANMAVPKAVLEEVGGFDVRLDRVGQNMLSGGDVFLEMQVIARGHPCLYYPKMAIRHLAPRSRLNQRWFEKRYYWQGISAAVMTLIDQAPSPRQRLGRAMRETMALLSRPHSLARLARSSDAPLEFQERCLALYRIGYIVGLLGRARA